MALREALSVNRVSVSFKSTERHFYQKVKLFKYNLSIAYVNRAGFWSRQIMFETTCDHPDARDEYATLKSEPIASTRKVLVSIPQERLSLCKNF